MQALVDLDRQLEDLANAINLQFPLLEKKTRKSDMDVSKTVATPMAERGDEQQTIALKSAFHCTFIPESDYLLTKSALNNKTVLTPGRSEGTKSECVTRRLEGFT